MFLLDILYYSMKQTCNIENVVQVGFEMFIKVAKVLQ